MESIAISLDGVFCVHHYNNNSTSMVPYSHAIETRSYIKRNINRTHRVKAIKFVL